ncbi:universal stress protein [Pseudoduganella aquatica]|uniref:Universal stress protein n=1 Tax=Pseudoduganella aquatica TaxID=2660641 RepID=A0A7X4H8R8_9BURK|nr:universal stress protein [Pseudoduganella aquatica]MYN06766.1 universal stress protein [Pseudoduganella aquatica]
MAYKSILVHAGQSLPAAGRMALAARLALACDAHLTGLACTGLSRYAHAGDVARLPPQAAERLALWRADAHAGLAAFEAAASHCGLMQYAPRLAEDTAEEALLHQAAFHDLLILGASGPDEDPHGVIRDLPQNLLLRCGRPLLLVPGQDAAGMAGLPFRHPLLAWDGSREAARAISDALPLLKMAQTATLLQLNDPHSARGDEPAPAPAMAHYLARHGVRADVRCEHTSGPVGDALAAIAKESGCGLLVMGGYGHRRLTETLLGGVTRTVLGRVPLPVLISH